MYVRMYYIYIVNVFMVRAVNKLLTTAASSTRLLACSQTSFFLFCPD